jgi:hypothetical protein
MPKLNLALPQGIFPVRRRRALLCPFLPCFFYSSLSWRRGWEQTMDASFNSYYRGGFEEKMSRREAGLILGCR